MRCQRIDPEARTSLLTRIATWSSIALLACAPSARARAEPETANPYRRLEIFARVLAHVEQSYVADADPDQLIYGAIRGMLRVLDPHSAFLDPQQVQILTSDSEGRYGGVGIEIDVRDGL